MILASTLLGSTCCLAALYPTCLSHDVMAWKFNSAFSQIPHPPGTHAIKIESDMGLILGNGNHCDFVVGQLRSYGTTETEIRNFYRGHTVLNPLNNERVPVEIAFCKNGKWESTDDVAFAAVDKELLRIANRAKQNTYIVFLYDGGYDPSIDIRCN
jgi:hypothetical protein